MRKAFKVFAAILLAIIVLVVAGILLAKSGVDNPVSDAAEKATIEAANAALDASGIKGQIDSALRSNVDAISRQTGLPPAVVEQMVEDLDVQSWTVAALPDGAVVTDTTAVTYSGHTVQVTSYDDPGYITLGTEAGEFTLAVPSNAQGYISYLEYL